MELQTPAPSAMPAAAAAHSALPPAPGAAGLVKPALLPAALITALQAELGPGGLVVEAGAVEASTRSCLPYRELAAAVVYPETAAQVQRVMELAHQHGVPVWPVSTGRNYGYNERSAVYPGGITMLLERMRRIEVVNETLGFAVIEPGVTYRQLNDHLKASGSRFWADCAGTTPDASVIGNALDKGRGLTPMADHFGALCGMDVVLPDGRMLETGGGSVGNNRVRHTYKWGVGPYLDGLFGQSNLGVVVKSGIWLMRAPERFDFAAFEYKADASRLGAFIDDLRELALAGALRSHPHLANDFAMMCILSQYPHELLEGRKSLSAQAAAHWRRTHGVAPWTFGCGLYGSREEVAYQKRMLRKVLGRYGMVQFIGAAVRDDAYGRLVRAVAPWANRLLGKSPEFTKVMEPAINLFRGIPSDLFVKQAYFKSHAAKPEVDVDPARDGCGFIWVGPVVPFESTHVMRALALNKEVCDRHDFDFFVEVIVESPRSMIVLSGVFYEQSDAADSARARAWYEDARDAFLAEGYPPYRATTLSMRHVMDGNPVARELLGAIKQAVDPRGVIAPGRYGVGRAPAS